MPRNDYFKEIKEILNLLSKEIYELKESQKKTDEQQKKTDEQLKKTDEEIERLTKKTDKEIEKVSKEVEKVSKEVEKVSKEVEKVSKEVEKVNKMVGNLTDGWGKFVEAIVFPSIPKLFSKQGIKIIDISIRKERHKGRNTLEIDIFALGKENGKDIILVTEVKSHLDVKTINDFVENNLDKFFDFFPEYRGIEIIGVMAGMRFGDGAEKYAQKKGLWVLGPSADIVQILNKKDFQPKRWQYATKMRRKG